MADHGTNRRRSHHARKRQNRGKNKIAMNRKTVTYKIKYWWNYWHGEREELEKKIGEVK
jgi:hypothetical protein